MRLSSMRVAAVVLLSAAGAAPTRADPPAKGVPAPDFGRVDHAHPEKYLGLDYDVGDREEIARIAKEVKGKDAEGTLKAIHAWIGSHLKYDDHAAYAWRTCTKMTADMTFGGCADHALLFGTIARACGIPTVWVKTMDVGWIRDFVDDPAADGTWSGHVFLEVHVDGRWMLLDATQGQLYRDHDVKKRVYPGDRWAYDRGGDPYALVLSVRWEDWKEQTRRHFERFDTSLLPAPTASVPAARRLAGCANAPVWEWIDAWGKAKNLEVRTTNKSWVDGFGSHVAWAAGGTVIVTDVGGAFCGPKKSFRDAGLTVESIRAERRKQGGSAAIKKKAPDGTRWVVLTADDAAGMKKLLDSLRLD